MLVQAVDNSLIVKRVGWRDKREREREGKSSAIKYRKKESKAKEGIRSEPRSSVLSTKRITIIKDISRVKREILHLQIYEK